MKKVIWIFVLLSIINLSFGQELDAELKMISDTYSENSEITDILKFEGINYLKIKFIGKKLKNKTYHLTVKEVWDGKITSEKTIVNSNDAPYDALKKINDSILNIKVISKLTNDNKLKMTFILPHFSINHEFNATESDDYSLRNVAQESKMDIVYNKKFYLLTYILPYDKGNGTKSWCDVGTDGKDIENWGKKFGIKHYLIFEMKFE